MSHTVKSNLTAIMGRASCHMGRTITWQEMLDSRFAFTDIADKLEFGGTAPVLPDANGNWPGPVPGEWVEV